MFTITLNTEGFETLKYEIKKELASELKIYYPLKRKF